jgi:formate-dependent nitrite reductase membrane component NrfD
MPVIKKPVWKARDVAGYLFLGGLAGASSVIAAAAQITRRDSLAKSLKLVSTAAISLSGVALVHDLGRPSRFINMLRVFKPTSPMSMGSWLLASYAPFSAAASVNALSGRFAFAGNLGTAVSAFLGPGVATYTAALISDTAVPAWHDAHRDMPFVFAASAAASASGAGLVAGPSSEVAPVRRLGIAAGVCEVAALDLMRRRMGLAGEAFAEAGRAKALTRASEAAVAIGVASAMLSSRSRLASAIAGLGLITGSACTRFAIFEAGIASADNPRYTIEPQRLRREHPQGPASPNQDARMWV